MANYVKDLMTPSPEGIKPSTPLLEAAKKMRNLDVGCLPVLEGNEIRGIFTDRDIVIKALANNKDLKTTPVEEIMCTDVQTCYLNDTIEEAAEKMEKLQIRRLLVLSDNDQLTGIITVGDIATRLHNDKLSGEIIEAVSKAA